MALISAISASVFAQRGNHQDFDPIKRATKMTDKLKTDLNLNDAQYAAVLKLNTEKASEKKSSFEAMKLKREAERNACLGEMKKVLTPEQYKAFEQKMIERREKRQEDGMHKMHNRHRNG